MTGVDKTIRWMQRVVFNGMIASLDEIIVRLLQCKQRLFVVGQKLNTGAGKCAWQLQIRSGCPAIAGAVNKW